MTEAQEKTRQEIGAALITGEHSAFVYIGLEAKENGQYKIRFQGGEGLALGLLDIAHKTILDGIDICRE